MKRVVAIRSSPRLRKLAECQKDAVVVPSTPSLLVVPKRRKLAIVTPLKSSEDDEAFEDLKVPPEELRPSTTLTNGQCFHWNAISTEQSTSAWGTHNATEWMGVLRMPPSTSEQQKEEEDRSLVVVIRETPSSTLYRVLYKPQSKTQKDVRTFLYQYFQLDIPLAPLYQQWSTQDARLERIAKCIRGVRILDQDPWECLASFICSSNNNIPRIHKILNSIRQEYGTLLLPKNNTKSNEQDIYSFPSLQTLQQHATDADLRNKCGMGYRAKYILETMKTLQSLGGEEYLYKLKTTTTTTPDQVQQALIQFSGVGRKVADCVALFSLRQTDAIPVDVHVWNIACRDYDPTLQTKKSLTPTVYRQVGELYQSRFTTKAGWAHSLLFVAELPSFRPILPEDMVQEMDQFRAEEQARKKASKAKKKSA
ncbi:N-glycosylase/DNA lyase [Seminavis robusta]|uniref:DNA-(apurinic or apyrimidinic site) lyase n=1 Tax=Seminavis robusta TaxID=568900 RepID=A0A9N8EST7_9STRA|nr:N-glycosylase/DNA lyase [Seminavis robusta]|eukprot:Sro1597_g284850.1 N-glycosylase/DNA lyase (423) ;mRNA; f:3166-4560